MNTDLNLLFRNIEDNKIPVLWMKISYGSLKPLENYFLDFVKRIDYMK